MPPLSYNAGKARADSSGALSHVGSLGQAHASNVVVAWGGQDGARLPDEEGHVDRTAELLLAARRDITDALDLQSVRGR